MAGAQRSSRPLTLLHVRGATDGYAPRMALGGSRLVTPSWIGGVALLVALGIHSATIAGASQLPPIESMLGGSGSQAEDAIDLDLEEEAAFVGPVQTPAPEIKEEPKADVAAAPPEQEEDEDVEEEDEPPKLAAASPQPLGTAPTETPSGDEDAEDEVPTPGSAEGSAPQGTPATGAPAPGAPGGLARYGIGDNVDEYGDPTPSPTGFGTGTIVSQHALAPADAASTTTPGAKVVTGDTVNNVLNGTVTAQDKKKGITFPGAGIVSGTVTTAVRALPLPHNARGTIEVTIAPGGKVTSTRVVSSSAGDAGTWDGVAKAIQGSLGGQTLDLGDASGTGAVVRLSVTQKHVYPTGTAKGADVKPVCANQVINDVIEGADNKPADPKEGTTIPIFTDEHGRPCIPVGVSAVADASNIGANKHIEVQTSMDVTIPGQKDLPQVSPVNTDAPWVNTPGKEGPRPTLPQKMRKRAADKKKKK